MTHQYKHCKKMVKSIGNNTITNNGACDRCQSNELAICHLYREKLPWESVEIVPANSSIMIALETIPDHCRIHNQNYSYLTTSSTAKFYKCAQDCVSW